jgi:hypothetical protein
VRHGGAEVQVDPQWADRSTAVAWCGGVGVAVRATARRCERIHGLSTSPVPRSTATAGGFTVASRIQLDPVPAAAARRGNARSGGGSARGCWIRLTSVGHSDAAVLGPREANELAGGLQNRLAGGLWVF